MRNDQECQPYEYSRYKYIIENIKDIIWELNTDFVFTFVSPNVKDMTGYEAEELVGLKFLDFLVLESRNYIYPLAIKHLNKRIHEDMGNNVLHDVQFICKNGTVKWVEVSVKPMFERDRFIGYIGMTRDITEKKENESQLKIYYQELKTMNEKLEKMATVDALTGAYNRRKFDNDINSLIANKEAISSFSLIFFDIDCFKTVNDHLGHKMGDRVLQCISRLVIENIRATDGLFRWGGDEFIMILPEVNLEGAKLVAEKIRNIIQSHNFGIDQKISVSLGVGEYKPKESFDQLMQRVDTALLKAKIDGRNRAVSC